MKKDIYNYNIIPQGKNGLTSRANFIQRKLYDKSFSILKNNIIFDNHIDSRNFYYDFLKYDQNNNIINISESTLKKLDDDVYAVNFVVDAFEELKLLCKNSDKIKNDKFKNLKAKNGWSNFHKKYHNHMNLIFKEFMKQINKSHKDKNIDNFEKFILAYVKFLDKTIYKTPFLKSSYLESKEYSVINTGFIIEIDTGDNGNDYKKIKNFFIDPEYSEFAKLCKKTNFSLDKDCPWRLIFNPFLNEAQNYMKNYNINKLNLFDEYFYKTEEFDLENLKQYMIILYNTFVKEKPTAHNVKNITINEKQILSRNFIDRVAVKQEEIDNKYKSSFWFNIYVHLKFVENKINLTNEQYISIKKELDENFKINGFKSCLNEMKKFIKNSNKTETKAEYNFILPSIA